MTCHAESIPRAPKPVCPACAAGYHDEVQVTPVHCACPCHGTETPKGVWEVLP